ncbi:MAG: metallophosphoesterase family protein [Gemmataceae bacterium]
MKILLIADIHANWPALQAVVREPHDLCFFVGDLVDYNLQPSPCIGWVAANARYTVRGNHDHGVAQGVPISGQSGFRLLTSVTRPLTQERISRSDRRFLTRLPVTRFVTIDETRFFLVHASPRDPLDEYTYPEVDFWSRRVRDISADVFCVGHTHLPYVLEVGDKLVVNPGSVGQPRDGDPRASYAIIEGNHVQLRRIEYPVEDSVKVIQQSTLPENAKGLLTQVLRTGTLPKNASTSDRKESATS